MTRKIKRDPMFSQCGLCAHSIPVGDYEVCWYCGGDLCAGCWEVTGHCGEPEAIKQNERAAKSHNRKREYVERASGAIVHLFNHQAGKSRCGVAAFLETMRMRPKDVDGQTYSYCEKCREGLV